MIKEIIINAKNADLATEKGAEELGVTVSRVQYEVIEEPKRGILGIGAQDGKFRIFYEETPAEAAKAYIESYLVNVGVSAEVIISEEAEENAHLDVIGTSEELGLLIGRHGDVLESLQNLTALVANKARENYYRITIDINGYRRKREETLCDLAKRMADRVLRTKRNYTFEPMTANERRIIHSAIQEIEGVTTYSIGNGEARKIVVSLASKKQ